MRAKARKGIALLATGAMIVVLVAFLGLAMDAGYLAGVKSRMQTAADTAAMAGAMGSARGEAAPDAARSVARLNGFAHEKNTVMVSVNTPPQYGDFRGDAGAVEVMITQTVPTSFFRILHMPTAEIRARAVARRRNERAELGE
jgi:uncharacterized membrane protein